MHAGIPPPRTRPPLAHPLPSCTPPPLLHTPMAHPPPSREHPPPPAYGKVKYSLFKLSSSLKNTSCSNLFTGGGRREEGGLPSLNHLESGRMPFHWNAFLLKLQSGEQPRDDNDNADTDCLWSRRCTGRKSKEPKLKCFPFQPPFFVWRIACETIQEKEWEWRLQEQSSNIERTQIMGDWRRWSAACEEL